MEGRAIAILEDNPTLRELLREVLEGEGHLVTVCHSLLEVHQAASAGPRWRSPIRGDQAS